LSPRVARRFGISPAGLKRRLAVDAMLVRAVDDEQAHRFVAEAEKRIELLDRVTGC